MESLGAISELNWNFADEFEVIMKQLFGAYPDLDEQNQEASLEINPMFWSDQSAGSYSSLDDLSSYWLGTSNANCTSTSSFFVSPEFIESVSHFTPEEQMSGSSTMITHEYQVEGLICSKDDENEPNDDATDTTSEAKRKLPEPESEIPTESSKEKARVSVQVQKRLKSVKSKKAQKNNGASEETPSNASFSSEEETNVSHEENVGTGNSAKGKTRAGRGSATDPQSLYARKRRERINERLRILQNLVPNGTKVDISTMLEDAVRYVKFLQLQIKLLSSDDMWMYAPLAYNGMDIGLDLKIPLSRQ
ncbi:uncharacterized protein A4U43_C08F12620 [Asparagus officinalis]|uniref:transcription factor bHLH54-like n=1 Tax=Asparagus officinalis TaxID=4686 RepID=UPI00098DF722|nr:transcription factor bHLH54-like [Asparagus officinalis]ONK59950.1 uncharacterized protein A4U43_C08F12620 [Asparagus officinalis]